MLALITAMLLTMAPTAKPHHVAAVAVALYHIGNLPVDTRALASVALVETGGTLRSDLVSRAGACGVMQVLPRWSALTCEQMGSPLGGVTAGAVAWHYWTGRAYIHTVAEHYNGGNRPGSAAKIYGRAWARIYGGK